MTSRIGNTTIDAGNAYTQSLWWSEILGMAQDPDDPNEPGHEECLIMSADGQQRLLFIEVPEGKQVKNRVHFDLRPTDRSRDEEIERVVGLGATVVDDRRNSDGTGWMVLADPESNEFCILRSEAEVAATQQS
jgi:predicted enzyme related to lactoylglutathione lyase